MDATYIYHKHLNMLNDQICILKLLFFNLESDNDNCSEEKIKGGKKGKIRTLLNVWSPSPKKSEMHVTYLYIYIIYHIFISQ